MLCAWWAEWPDEPEHGAPHEGGALVRCSGVVLGSSSIAMQKRTVGSSSSSSRRCSGKDRPDEPASRVSSVFLRARASSGRPGRGFIEEVAARPLSRCARRSRVRSDDTRSTLCKGMTASYRTRDVVSLLRGDLGPDEPDARRSHAAGRLAPGPEMCSCTRRTSSSSTRPTACLQRSACSSIIWARSGRTRSACPGAGREPNTARGASRPRRHEPALDAVRTFGSRNGTMVDVPRSSHLEDARAPAPPQQIRIGDAIFTEFVEGGAGALHRRTAFGLAPDLGVTARRQAPPGLSEELVRRNAQNGPSSRPTYRAGSRPTRKLSVRGDPRRDRHRQGGRRARPSSREREDAKDSFQDHQLRAPFRPTCSRASCLDYRRGAFSRRRIKTRQARSIIKLADRRGTLFLDEIGDMPLEAQAKLLPGARQAREVVTLWERRMHAAGSGSTSASSARPIAICDQFVKEGKFRGDLFARLERARRAAFRRSASDQGGHLSSARAAPSRRPYGRPKSPVHLLVPGGPPPLRLAVQRPRAGELHQARRRAHRTRRQVGRASRHAAAPRSNRGSDEGVRRANARACAEHHAPGRFVPGRERAPSGELEAPRAHGARAARPLEPAPGERGGGRTRARKGADAGASLAEEVRDQPRGISVARAGSAARRGIGVGVPLGRRGSLARGGVVPHARWHGTSREVAWYLTRGGRVPHARWPGVPHARWRGTSHARWRGTSREVAWYLTRGWRGTSREVAWYLTRGGVVPHARWRGPSREVAWYLTRGGALPRAR